MAKPTELERIINEVEPDQPQQLVHGNKQEQLILENLQKIVSRSVDGEKHNQLVKAAFVAGGYISGGLINEADAVQTLQSAISNKPGVDDLKSAFRDIQDGIEKGKKKPIYELDNLKPQTNTRNTIQQAEQTESESLSGFEHLRITDNSDIPKPEPILYIAGETIAVNGDIFTISGASKSGKSAFTGMAIAAALKPDGVCPDAIEGMQVKPNPNNHAILHFDTEQAAHKHKMNLISILRRSNLETCPDHLLSYNIRKLPLASYAATTTAICDLAVKEFGGIHSIWVDGGADYVADVNDQLSSNQVVKYFEDLSIKYNTCVFLIIHTNPGGDKERGHFGSHCQRKSGGILTVKQVGDVSYLEPKLLRYAGKGDIQKLAFQYDKVKGYHVGSGVHVEPDPEQQARERKIKQAKEICDEVFSGQRSYKYKDALDRIAEITLKSITVNKGIFTVMKSQDMIKQDENGYWRKKT